MFAYTMQLDTDWAVVLLRHLPLDAPQHPTLMLDLLDGHVRKHAAVQALACDRQHRLALHRQKVVDLHEELDRESHQGRQLARRGELCGIRIVTLFDGADILGQAFVGIWLVKNQCS